MPSRNYSYLSQSMACRQIQPGTRFVNKIYCNTVMSICLHAVYSYLHATKVEMYNTQGLKYLPYDPLKKLFIELLYTMFLS